MTAWVKAALVLTIIGAINWGFVGIFGINIVDAIFGGGAYEETSILSRIIYTLVGIAGVAAIWAVPRVRASSAKGAP